MEYIELKNITKTFNAVKALDDVSLSFKKGEVHAVVGENGAGKSTIMKILGGLYFADGGEIYIDGKKKNIANVSDALAAGISIVYQELNLMKHLSVAENIFLQRLQKIGPFVSKTAMNNEAQRLLDQMGVNIKATELVGSLGVSEQQMVEIAKALSKNADIIIMDEPTAALNNTEVDALYKLIASLKTQNKTIIYISHRMKEIFDLSDRVSVLRDGKYIATKKTAEISEDKLVELMVGREISAFYTTSNHEVGGDCLVVKDLNHEKYFSDINFTLKKGEILGIAGLMGCFREELVKSLYGLIKVDSGSLTLDGKDIMPKSPKEAMDEGIGFVTEDRKNSGIFALMSVRENLTINIVRALSKFGFVNANAEQELLDGYTAKMNMKYSSYKQRINGLSGGNQQKFVLARALAGECKVLILLEPTRGIDVGAKAEIYELIGELARSGVSTIIVSSELPEIMRNCHRTLVMFQGRITGNILKKDFDETEIMACATGTKTHLEVMP